MGNLGQVFQVLHLLSIEEGSVEGLANLEFMAMMPTSKIYSSILDSQIGSVNIISNPDLISEPKLWLRHRPMLDLMNE